MRDHAIVSPLFWTGETGRKLRAHPDAQRLALYLMTCPSSNMIGLYYLPIPTICHELNMTSEGASEALRRVSEGGFASYDPTTETVFVYQMARFQVGEQLAPKDNRIKAVERQLEAARKSCHYKEFLRLYAADYHLQHLSPFEGPSKPLRSQDQDQDQEQGQGQDLRRRAAGRETTKSTTPDPEPKPTPDHGATEAFDPLVAEQDDRKTFLAAWNGSGLRKCERKQFNTVLQAKLKHNLADGWWRENYAAAITRAAKIPFLAGGASASGSVRQKGPLDVFEFLNDPDLVRRIISGALDDRSAPATGPPRKPTAPATRPVIDPEVLRKQCGRTPISATPPAPKPPTATEGSHE